MTPDPLDQTSGREEARRAYKESRDARSATDKLVEEVSASLATVSSIYRENHFAQKMSAIIRGARQ